MERIFNQFLSDTPILLYGSRIVIAIIVVVAGRWWADHARRNLNTIIIKAGLTESFNTLISTLIYYAILLLIAILVLVLLGVPMTAIATVIAAILVTLSIAFQQTLGNVAAAVIFMLFQPFKVGDIVETGGIIGTVKEIQLFNTVVVTFENQLAIIPNRNIQNNSLINYSALGVLRADMTFGVSYSDDLRLVKKIMQEAMTADDRILTEPPSSVVVKNLGESSVDFSMRPYVGINDYWDVKFDMNERVKSRFEEVGISIPFPQQDVHLFNPN